MELLVLQEFRVAVHSLTNLKCQKAVKNRRDLIFLFKQMSVILDGQMAFVTEEKVQF